MGSIGIWFRQKLKFRVLHKETEDKVTRVLTKRSCAEDRRLNVKCLGKIKIPGGISITDLDKCMEPSAKNL